MFKKQRSRKVKSHHDSGSIQSWAHFRSSTSHLVHKVWRALRSITRRRKREGSQTLKGTHQSTAV